MPGRFRTASSPSKTVIFFALYDELLAFEVFFAGASERAGSVFLAGVGFCTVGFVDTGFFVTDEETILPLVTRCVGIATILGVYMREKCRISVS